MKSFTQVMKALSDPGRVKIMKMLLHKELCVCEIQEALGLAQPTISKHLKVLEDAGLVRRRKQSMWVNYLVETSPESPYAAAMIDHLAEWLEEDPEITLLVTRLPHIRRETICKQN